MFTAFDILIFSIILIVIIDIILICKILIKNIKNAHNMENRKNFFHDFILKFVQTCNIGTANPPLSLILNYFEQFMVIRQSLLLDKNKNFDICKNINIQVDEDYYCKKLFSKFKLVRMNSAMHLSNANGTKSFEALKSALLSEKNIVVKLYIAYALSSINKSDSIPILVSSLKNAPKWYREKVNVFISESGNPFLNYLPEIINDHSPEIQDLIVDFASVYTSKELRDYLFNIVENCSNNNCIADIFNKCLNIIENLYFFDFTDEKYLNHTNTQVRNCAIRALSKNPTIENLNKLLSLTSEFENNKDLEFALSAIIKSEHGFIKNLIEIFNSSQNENTQNCIAEVLSNKIEYLILKLTSKNKQQIREVIKKIIILGKNSSIIGFLNRNTNIEIENELVDIIKEIFWGNDNIAIEYCTYLNERTLKKCGIERCKAVYPKREEKRNKGIIKMLYSLLVLILLTFPIVYILRHITRLSEFTTLEHFISYVRDFNYYLAYYSITINSIYLILLMISFFGVSNQAKYWNLKSMNFLFKKRMLPSITIIAPAFNEEATIIESVNSLLNLRYPDYELIIVNDGSKDQTLNTLINYFQLERINYNVNNNINTMPIRGVYSNKYISKLVVIDKENGGKADSLNAGINVSTKDYFCGIDADSLLETDALIKLASLTLDTAVENVALGGNILPINGCSVKRGFIEKIRLPKNINARFQTIEYIRAFMGGRIAWAKINSLLIISGAFGLFKKDRIIEIGGYLTSSGKYGKDTVGEDMELVVRLSRHLLEKKQNFKVNYAFNANCWTEVPESIKILRRQRDRWHRGLIDILTFHKELIFNPKYKEVGLIAFPYFFIFEVVGPLIEIQGYFMVVLAALFGLLDTQITLLLFISTILMGTLISLVSLLLTQKEHNYFSIKEILVLIAFSIIENFGFRQIVSFWRVLGYLSSIQKPKGWGKMERKGFTHTAT